MTAGAGEMDELSSSLWKKGVAGFCATTLSVARPDLRQSVARIGAWIARGKAPGAIPLGIHLEGPFISPKACGAHPPEAIRKLDFKELADLWDVSRGTLKLLTIAPETLKPAD